MKGSDCVCAREWETELTSLCLLMLFLSGNYDREPHFGFHTQNKNIHSYLFFVYMTERQRNDTGSWETDAQSKK